MSLVGYEDKREWKWVSVDRVKECVRMERSGGGAGGSEGYGGMFGKRQEGKYEGEDEG